MAATYTVKQVAQILGYSTNSIYTFLKEKRIKSVRVGKGRFRIPQTEVDRLLMSTKGSAVVMQPAAQAPILPTPPAPTQAVMDVRELPPIVVPLFGVMDRVTSNIFDWYLGMSAVITGLALFLFNQSFDITNIAAVSPVMPAARIVLIGAGLGILLTNIYYKPGNFWHKAFHGLLVVVGVAMVVTLMRSRDVDAVVLYGSLVFMTGLTMVLPLGRIASFSLYLTLLAIGGILVPILGPTDFHVVAFSNLLHMTPSLMAVWLAIGNIGFVLLLWYGYFRNRGLFWVATWIAAAVFFALGFWYAQTQYWSRAFVLIISGLTSMFLASWEELSTTKSRRAQVFAIAIFGSIFFFFIISVLVVYLMQQNILENVKRENVNKLEYGRLIVQETLDGAKNTIMTAARDQNFVRAVAASDTAAMTSISRTIFDTSNTIRRIVILDSRGMGLFLYPLGTFDQRDLSFRDYFIAARDTGNVYVSGVFQSLVDKSHRQVITVATPMYNEKKAFVGVLAFSLDLEALAARLQKIPLYERGEYMVVLDDKGKRILHPDASLIGSDTEVTDPTRLGILGQSGVAESDTYNGVHSLTVYTTVHNGLHWAIAIKSPFSGIYEFAQIANLAVAAILIGSIIIGIFFLQAAHVSRAQDARKSGERGNGP